MPSVPADIRSAYDLYTRGPALLRAAISGLDAGAINARQGDSWSSRDIVVHLADAELVRAARIRLILTEDAPVIVPWDENKAQRRLQYLWRSPEASLATFEMACFSTAEILMHIDRLSWQRAGTHPERGELTIAALVAGGAEHIAAHVAQIEDLRAATKR